MEMGKLTAKLRDAVPVCFIEDGKEIKRYKNVEIPDELKVLPFADFKFDVPATGAITFKIMFEAGILPKEWPQARERKRRSVQTAPVAAKEVASEAAPQTNEPLTDIIEPTEQAEVINATTLEVMPPTEENADTLGNYELVEINFNVAGERRKALVEAVSSFIGKKAEYLNAPTFAYRIGDYMVSKTGALIGPESDQLLQALAARNFITE